MNNTSGRGVRNCPVLWRRRSKVLSLVPSPLPQPTASLTAYLIPFVAYEYYLWKGVRTYPELWRRRGKVLSLVPCSPSLACNITHGYINDSIPYL
jgi:hypothetical protein